MLRLKVLGPESRLLEKEVDSVSMMTVSGSIGVLQGHTPLAAKLGAGTKIEYVIEGERYHLDVTGGFARVLPDDVTVFTI